jgi:hypothetical protein
MYDAFDDHADTTPYTAVAPAQSLGQTTTKAPTGIDAVLPYDKLDLVPQELFDRALWHSVYGPDSKPPKPGPDASPIERGRAETALDAYRSGRSVRDALLGLGAAVDPDG